MRYKHLNLLTLNVTVLHYNHNLNYSVTVLYSLLKFPLKQLPVPRTGYES